MKQQTNTPQQQQKQQQAQIPSGQTSQNNVPADPLVPGTREEVNQVARLGYN